MFGMTLNMIVLFSLIVGVSSLNDIGKLSRIGARRSPPT